MSERIAIVGAGAVGAYVGGYFSRAGEDVTLPDPNEAPANAAPPGRYDRAPPHRAGLFPANNVAQPFRAEPVD